VLLTFFQSGQVPFGIKAENRFWVRPDLRSSINERIGEHIWSP